MAKSRIVGTLVAVTVLLGASVAAWYFLGGRAAPPPKLTSVAIARGDLTQGVTATGVLQAVTTVDVSSQISGQIAEVLVDYNSPVKEGDVLARIDPATYQSRLRQAEAQLANTRANHNLVRLNAERVRNLHDKNLVSAQELDQSEAQLAQADAQLQIQNAAVENAKVDLSRCTLLAPIDGIVIDRIAEVGKTVAASLNAPTLFTIVNDLSKMQIAASVAEADIGSINNGQDVQFTVDAYPSRQFRGRVSQVRNSPKTEQSVVVYATIIDVDNADGSLKPGMTANVNIIVARRAGALRLPNVALRLRAPEELLTGAPPPEPAAPGVQVAQAQPSEPRRAPGEGRGSGEGREAMRQLFQEAGISFGAGPPSAEALTKLRALAAERGITLPERFAAPQAKGVDAVVSRIVYREAGTPEKPKLEPVRVKLGISDGITTEIIEGLAEGDKVVTAVTGAPGTTSRPAANPFSGGRRF
jgi:HlyD family secretion protein